MSRKSKHLKENSRNVKREKSQFVNNFYDRNSKGKILESRDVENRRNLKNGRRNKESEKFTIVQKVLLIIFICIFCYSAFTLISWYIGTKKAESKYEDLAQKVITEDINQEPDENKNKPQGINFDELKQINEDIIGWIKIDGTTINYPIVKTTDNEFYLKKDIYKEYDSCGSIFMDYKNHENFTDKNNVIYGHHIKSGIMFADLVNIYKGNLGTDIDVNIYTPSKERVYKIFSSYESNPEDYAINTSIKESEYDEFIENLKNRSSIDYKVSPKESSQILTLSTCDNTGKKRILVHAKLDKVFSLENRD